MVDTKACRKLSITVVSSAPLAKACVAWVCLIQCGLARRNFSAVFGDSIRTNYGLVKRDFSMSDYLGHYVLSLGAALLFGQITG